MPDFTSSLSEAFVGRHAELDALHRAWDVVKHGRARFVGIDGGSGIGKTALVRRFLVQASPAREAWLSGAPDESALPWSVLSALLGRTKADGGPGGWEEPAPEADPLYVGQRLLDGLRAVGELIIVLDDAQWADRQSQAALRFVARHMFGIPVLLIVIRNEESGQDDSWRRICDLDHAESLRLGGMTPEDLVRLAVAHGYSGLSPAGAARLHEHTGGNPLYAQAILSQVPMRQICSGAGPLPAPRTLADAVAETLTARSGSAQALLAAAAVLGLTFDPARAASLAGLCDVTPALDEAATAGLVCEVPGADGRLFAFGHALVQRAIYERTGLARRRELHRRAAGLLTGAEAIRHRVAAADGPDAELAADLERQAAIDVSAGQLAVAADRLRQALDLTPPGPDRVPRLLAVVEADLVAGDAVAAGRYADEIAAGGGDPWWDYVAGYQSLLAGRVDDAQLRFKRALYAIAAGVVPPHSPADLQARVATQLAIIGAVTFSYPEMIEYGQLAVASQSTDARVLAFAWFARTVGLALAGRGGEALADLDAHGVRPGLEPLVARGLAELWTDDVGAGHRHLKEAVERAYRGEALRVNQAMAFLGDAEFRLGLLADSAFHCELAIGDAEENEHYWDYAMLHGLACQPRAARGDWAQAEAHAAAASQWAPWIGARSGLAYAAGARAIIAQARDDGRALLQAAAEFEAVFDPREPGTALVGPLRAQALARLGRVDEATAALADYCTRYEMVGRRSASMGVCRVRGQIACAAGANTTAMANYTQALDQAESLRLPLEAGRVEMHMGECLAASGNYDGAGMRLRSALRRFSEIGAGAYRAQVHRRLRDLGLPADASADPFAILSGAERRVARLAGKGLSNEEIAEQLVLTRKTVEFHLTNIYRTLGVTSRAALRKLLARSQEP